MNALMRLWHDLLQQPESRLFFSLSVPFLRRPRSHDRLLSVHMNTDIGHRLQPIAFAIRAPPPPFPQLLMLPAWHAAEPLRCGEGQSYTDEKWGCVFPFVYLFVSSVFPCCPTLAALLPHDSFSASPAPPPPVLPINSHQQAPVTEGYANFSKWETDSGLGCCTAWTQKRIFAVAERQPGVLLPRCLIRARRLAPTQR